MIGSSIADGRQTYMPIPSSPDRISRQTIGLCRSHDRHPGGTWEKRIQFPARISWVSQVSTIAEKKYAYLFLSLQFLPQLDHTGPDSVH